MKINSAGAASHIDMGVVSRPMSGFGNTSDHDNGVRAHGKPDTFRSDFRSLVRAVKSGDMTSAQSALDTIKTDIAARGTTYSPASTTASSASAISVDLKSLFDAVGSGDATAAQSALVQFASDSRSTWQAQTQTSPLSSPTVQGHHGRRFYDLESVIASLFSDSSSTPPSDEAPSSTDTSSTPPADSASAPTDTATPASNDAPATTVA